MASIWSKILYKYFGPTTVHLQNEFVLLVISCLFTSASFCTMYHSNEYIFFGSIFGNNDKSDGYQCRLNEIIYIILSTAWLGRHLVQRIIATTEANTSTSYHGRIGVHSQYHPSLLSSMCKIWIWIGCGGQYFDIPSCPIQFALHGPSSSLNSFTTSSTTTTSSSNSGNHNSTNSHAKTNKFNSIIQNIFQFTNVENSMVGFVDHHHRAMNKSNSDSLITRKTPPIHRTYIVQVFFIIPMLVVPISITKFIMSSLRSRKRPTGGFYDSDDDDYHHTDHHRRRKRRGGDNHNLHDDNDNSDSEILDGDDENGYIKIHFKTQNEINSHLDTVWKYTPPAQFVVFFCLLSFFVFAGFKFYFSSINSFSESGNASRGNKRFGYENNIKHNNPGVNNGYAQNLYPGGPSSPGSNFGSQSTILNAELMAQRFELKQRQTGNEMGGNLIQSSISSLLGKISHIAAKIHITSWKATFYGPWGMFYMISLWGVVASLLLFGRIVLPIPDLAARGRESWVGKGTNKSHKQKRKERSWVERYMPITSGNRFHLYFKIMIVRIIENAIVCAIIPQSSFMCRATGHCNIEPTIFEIGDPTLIQSRSRGQGQSMFDNLIYDHLVANLLLVSVIITSALMILCQLLVLDRNSLSLEAYSHVQGNANNSMKASDSLHKRGGKKHNSIGNDSHKFWNDNSNSGMNAHVGDKKKSNLLADIKDGIYDCFALEIGAMSTSQILSYVFYSYTAHALIVVLLASFYCLTGRDWYPLVLALFAIFTAAGGSDFDTAEFDELDEIALEISYSQKKSRRRKAIL